MMEALSYRNQAIALLYKLMDWFLYDREKDKKDLNEKVIYSSRGSRNELDLLEQAPN